MVLDKFHLIKNANEAVDKVRRAEVRLGGKGGWEVLHKSQWLWRKNPEHLTGPEQERLAFMEGLKSVFSATKRKARGYRSTTHHQHAFLQGGQISPAPILIPPKTAGNLQLQFICF